MTDSPFQIVQSEIHKADGSIVIVKAVQTCIACPSQWDAWDANGQYYYLRWRNSRGSVDAFDDKEPSTWGTAPLGTIAHWRGDLPWKDGELQAFCDRAGLTLAPDADVTTYQEYMEEYVDRLNEEEEREPIIAPLTGYQMYLIAKYGLKGRSVTE